MIEVFNLNLSGLSIDEYMEEHNLDSILVTDSRIQYNYCEASTRIEQTVNDSLDECYPTVEIMGITFTPSDIPAKDKVAYAQAIQEEIDGIIRNNKDNDRFLVTETLCYGHA